MIISLTMQKESILIDRLIKAVMAASILYWLYLIIVAQMVIVQDAIGFEQLGTIIHEKGFAEFLCTSPHRDPLYPFLIALSMSIGEALTLSYQTVLKFIHFLFLFLTQLMSLRILRKLEIHPLIILTIIFYIGFCPAIVASALNLFSEIAAYPFVVGIILMSFCYWKESRVKQAVILGLCFLGAAFVRGVFEFIFPLFILPFIIFIGRKWLKEGRREVINLNPDSAYLYVDFGKFYMQIGKFTEAEKLFKKALEINPEEVLSFRHAIIGHLITTYIELGKLDEAKILRNTHLGNAKDFKLELQNNYQIIRRLCALKKVQLIAVQYPMRDIQSLIDILEPVKKIVFVENKYNFEEAISSEGYYKYFTDHFGGDFGHCTPKGNHLLAKNVANSILSIF